MTTLTSGNAINQLLTEAQAPTNPSQTVRKLSAHIASHPQVVQPLLDLLASIGNTNPVEAIDPYKFTIGRLAASSPTYKIVVGRLIDLLPAIGIADQGAIHSLASYLHGKCNGDETLLQKLRENQTTALTPRKEKKLTPWKGAASAPMEKNPLPPAQGGAKSGTSAMLELMRRMNQERE
jgi:hypothetical protein